MTQKPKKFHYCSCAASNKKNVIYTEYPNSTFANWEIELCGFLMGEKWFYQVQQTLQKQRLIFISSTSALSEENSHAVLELHLHIFDEWSLSKEKKGKLQFKKSFTTTACVCFTRSLTNPRLCLIVLFKHQNHSLRGEIFTSLLLQLSAVW